MHGLFNYHKPSGVTSRAAVDRVQRRLPAKTRIGHAGTLDPLAEGVLVLCVGRATRLISYVQQMRKHYRATYQLGCESETEDAEGEVVPRPEDPRPTLAAIESALPSFIGQIAQRPPVYSALKVDGRRAYKLARGGHAVEMQPRPIQIHALRVVHYEYPELVLDIVCGRGTYVRSLGRDIAERLGTAAVMSGLIRTGIGNFTIDQAVNPSELRSDSVSDYLLPLGLAVADLPRVVLTDEQIARVANGLSIADRFSPDGFTLPEASEPLQEVAAFGHSGRLIAILVPGRGLDREDWGPVRNFADIS